MRKTGNNSTGVELPPTVRYDTIFVYTPLYFMFKYVRSLMYISFACVFEREREGGRKSEKERVRVSENMCVGN